MAKENSVADYLLVDKLADVRLPGELVLGANKDTNGHFCIRIRAPNKSNARNTLDIWFFLKKDLEISAIRSMTDYFT